MHKPARRKNYYIWRSLMVLGCVFFSANIDAQTEQSLISQDMQWKKQLDQVTQAAYTISTTQLIVLNDKFALGIDASLQKNTLDLDGPGSPIMEVYWTQVPMYIDFFLDKQRFLELGVFWGWVTTPHSKFDFAALELPDLEEMAFRMDQGWIAGAGWDISNFARLRLRYILGSPRFIPVNDRERGANQFLEFGFSWKI